MDTVFDLASLTKVIATTTLAMRAVDAGRIDLDAPLRERLPLWRGDDRAPVTPADLLAHAAGLTAHLPFYRDHRGRADYEAAICTLPLEYAPRSASLYSDLGFILLGFLLEDACGSAIDAQFAARAAHHGWGESPLPSATRLARTHRAGPSRIPGAGGCSWARCTMKTPGRWAGWPATPAYSARRAPWAALRARLRPVSGAGPRLRHRRPSTASRPTRQSRVAPGRWAGTRCCPHRPAGDACPPAPSGIPASPGHRCGSIPRQTPTSRC